MPIINISDCRRWSANEIRIQG